MNRKEKLLVDMWVFLLSGIICLTVLVCTLPPLIWRDFLGVLAWPCLGWVYGGSFSTWPCSPWFWWTLAAVLLWLVARPFWTSSRRAVWLGAAAVVVWWLAGLLLVWGSIVAEC